MRFKSENIILSTVYYGNKKPNVTNLLYLLAQECDEFNKKHLTVYKNDEFWNFFPVVSLCVFDLPARAEAQCFKGSTGNFGCPCCYRPGVAIKNNSKSSTIRYIHQDVDHKKWTHNETIQFTQSVLNGDLNSIKGVKGQSSLILFDHIDVINSVGMHVVSMVFYLELQNI